MTNEHVVIDNVWYESSQVKYPLFKLLEHGLHFNIIIY